jgi:hypothetical protein
MPIKMERESNAQLKQIQLKIKQALVNNKVDPTPESIIKYTAQTIMQLGNDQMIPHLYSVIFIYKDFIRNSSTLLALINSNLSGKHQDRVLRLIKALLNNGEHPIPLFKDLLDFYYKSKSDKIKKVLEIFNIKDEYALTLEDEEFLKFYDLFFDSLVDKVEFRDRLGNLDNKYTYNILLKYTGYIIDGPRIDDTAVCEKILDNLLASNKKENTNKKTFEQKIEALNFVINTVKMNKDISNHENVIMEIFNKIFSFNNINHLKTKTHVIELTKDLKDFIELVALSKNTDIRLVQDFFSINRLYLIPNYISLIRNITCTKLLQYLVSAVDIEILSQIIELDMNLIRFSTNNDISLFFKLYDKDNNMINIMPTFLDYCTDNENLIVKFTDFLTSKITTNYVSVCTCLRNIIRSHELNFNKEIYLRNIITKETSERILKEVTKYEIFSLVITNYQHNGAVNDLLFLMINYLPNLDSDCNLLSNEIIQGEFKNLNIVKFFIPKMNVSLDFVSKIIDECTKNNDDQKRFYELLYHLEKNNKIQFNICAELYAQDMVDNIKANSLKMRMKCLYLRLLKGCCNKSEECRNRFLSSLMTSFCLGNKSAKDVNTCIVNELMATDMKSSILDFIEENMKSNDSILRSGCLLTFVHLLKYNVQDMKVEYMKNIYNYMFVVYKDINALIIIKVLTNFVAYSKNIITQDLLEIIEYYIDSKKKKYRKDIKNIIRLIISKKIFNINRRIKQYYKFKIKTETEEIIIKKKK